MEIIKPLNSSLNDLGGFKPVIDESTGKITGYKTTIGGADTVFPFSSCDLENKTPVAKSKSASVDAVIGKKYLIFVVGTRYPNDISLSMTGINILLKTAVVSTSSGAHGSGCMVVGMATDTTIKINCGDGYGQNEYVASIATQLD